MRHSGGCETRFLQLESNAFLAPAFVFFSFSLAPKELDGMEASVALRSNYSFEGSIVPCTRIQGRIFFQRRFFCFCHANMGRLLSNCGKSSSSDLLQHDFYDPLTVLVVCQAFRLIWFSCTSPVLSAS